jgi:hypothetical protein
MTLISKIWSAIVTTIQTHRAPKWAAEPVRRIANYVVGLTVTAGALLVAATQFTHYVPAKYQGTVTAWVAAATVVVGAVAKVAGEIARSKVFAPATVARIAAANGSKVAVRVNNDTVEVDPNTIPGY